MTGPAHAAFVAGLWALAAGATPTPADSVRAWQQRGREAYAAGRTEESIEELRRACAGARENGAIDVSECAYELGYVLYESGAFDEAARWWEISLRSLPSSADPGERVWRHSDLAEVQRLRGRYAAAESLLVVAREIVEASDLRDRIAATALNNLAALQRDQDRLDEAERLYRDALQRTRALNEQDDSPEQARRVVNAHLNLGNLLLDQDRPQIAERELRTALELAAARLPRADPALFYTRDALARAALARDDLPAATRWWDAALSGIERDTSAQAANLRADLVYERGRAALNRGDYAVARHDARAAAEHWEEGVGQNHPLLAKAWALEASALSGLGEPVLARARCDQALQRLGDRGAWPEERALAFSTRARLHHAAGDLDEALHDAQTALREIDDLRARRGGTTASRASFLRRHAAVVEDLVQWRMEAEQPLAALEAAEALRARTLRDELQLDAVDPHAGVPASIAQPLERREREARAALAALRRRANAGEPVRAAAWDSTLARLDSVLEEWRLHSPAWSRALQSETSVSVADLRRRALRPGVAWLYYQWGAEELRVFLVAAEPEPVLMARVPRVEADPEGWSSALIEEVSRGVVGIRPAGDDAAPAVVPSASWRRWNELFERLVPASFRAVLSGLDEVVVIPDGPLHAISFEALVVRESEGQPVYWLDEYPVVSYAHGLNTLGLAPRADRSVEAEVLSVCRPEHPRSLRLGGQVRALPDLPGTERESEAIVAALGASRVNVLKGAAATEAAVRAAAPRARYLHLATHGLLDRSVDHRLAALALTPPQGEVHDLADDGMLQLFEVYALDLDCDLAVLSACDTHGGPTEAGEGVYALSRAFHVAGARQVMATLWPVADASTAQLVGAVFERLAAARATGAEPDFARFLRDAKRELRANSHWSHPAFWAPFVLTGTAPSRGGSR